MKTIAVDPGTTQSAFVEFYPGSKDPGRIGQVGILDNSRMLWYLTTADPKNTLVIEMIASYGMPAGQTLFETCVWIGQFIDAFGGDYSLLYRREVKREICGSPHAKDANIRQALIDKFGPPGTKKHPGPTHGFKKDVWAALGVAVAFEQMRRPIRKLLASDPEEFGKWAKQQDEKREKRRKKKLASGQKASAMTDGKK